MDDVPAASLGESRWPPAIAVLVFTVLNVSLRIWLPSDRATSVPWLLPSVEVALLTVLVLEAPTSDRRRARRQLRRAAIVLVGLLLVAALWATVVLIEHLVTGAKQTNDGGELLASGSLVWLGNILAFSLLYWVFDSGGPRARTSAQRAYPDFAFPQGQDPDLAPPGWHPIFVDYLYLGFCTSTAFSPTDVIPLARWAKLAMAVQSAVSLAVIGLVIALPSTSSPDAAAERPRSDWVEIAAAVLLAVAAIATAWSSYQASRWNGRQAEVASRANASRTAAARAADLASNQTQIDIATFIQWVDATARGDQALEQFYEQRFRPEFRPAFAAWLATKPLTNPDAPQTPFVMPEYKLAATAEAQRLDAETDVLAAAVPRNVQRATNYVLGVVLFAVALFFAAMSTKVHGRGAREGLLGVGVVVFLGALAWIASLPVSISV